MKNKTNLSTDKPLHILLADDDQDDRHFFNKALIEISSDSILSTVDDGDKLMKLLLNESAVLPDVLFLDINMPRKSGTECLIEIKRSEKLKNMPVVMFSTANDMEKIKMHFKSGASVYIRKPSDFTQLKQVIHHALPISTEKMFGKVKTKFILNA